MQCRPGNGHIESRRPICYIWHDRLDDAILTDSAGNVFADLEVGDPEGMLVKAELARAISGLIRARQLTQAQDAHESEYRLGAVRRIAEGTPRPTRL